MRKKHFVLFWLWLAFSVVLGHNVVPHHHYDEHEAAALPGNHHHGDEDDSPLADFFSQLAHGPYTSTVTYLDNAQTHDVSLKKVVAEPVSELAGICTKNALYVPHQPPDWGAYIPLPDYSLRLPPRAPPVI